MPSNNDYKKVKPGPEAIALISHSNSGISHYTYSLALALAQHKTADIHFITNRFFKCVERRPMKVAPVFGRSRWLLFSLLKFAAYVVRSRIRVLHFQGPVKYPVLTLAIIFLSKLTNRKNIYTAHDVLPHYARKYHQAVMRMIYEHVDGVIVHSKDNHDSLRDIAPGVAQSAIIPHGLYDMFVRNAPASKAEARGRLGLSVERKVILFFGRIDERKGARMLVSQLHLLVNELPDIQVIMVGRSAYAPGVLESIAAENGVGGYLKIFDGWVGDDEVATYFVAADAVILPYKEGSTSGVIKIALATGTPVIATRVGELPEIIEETGCGVLIDMPFSKADTEAIRKLLSQEGGARCRRDMAMWRQKFSWEEIAKKTLSFYKEIGAL